MLLRSEILFFYQCFFQIWIPLCSIPLFGTTIKIIWSTNLFENCGRDCAKFRRGAEEILFRPQILVRATLRNAEEFEKLDLSQMIFRSSVFCLLFLVMKKSKKGKHKTKLLYSEHGTYHKVKRILFAAKAAVGFMQDGIRMHQVVMSDSGSG